ncbi:hypothetical protein B0J17DRAFT_640002 [Rhizoctonia solani]|nr:hypothetical protein B0J17DRAFT_640002 [Rhizoctonia solani]
MSNSGCATCEARNKKCDQTRGPNGCRRCAKAGLKCGGYLDARITKSIRGARNSEPQARLTVIATPHHDSPDLATNKSTEHFNPDLILENSGQSGEDRFTGPLAWSAPPVAASPPQQHMILHSHTTFSYEQIPTPPTEHVTTPPIGHIPIPPDESSPRIGQMPTPPSEGIALPPINEPATQTHPSGSTVSLPGEPSVLPWAPASPGSTTRNPSPMGAQSSSCRSQTRSTFAWSTCPDEVDPEDRKTLEVALLDGLVLDRGVESNMVSFLVHSFTSWMSRFLFEPNRVIPLFREAIVRSHSYGREAHQQMVLIANSVLNVSESTDYDLTPFIMLYNQLVTGVAEARSRGNLTREAAVQAMQSCHEVISIMCKVCSLASVLNTMDLCAPVFRRACPESGNEFVNLPRVLTGFDVHLKLYATMDVLLSAITHRPMFFRYNLDFLSQLDEELLNSDDGPGLRWLAGVPDRLIVTLAKMNTFLEDYGNRVDLGMVKIVEGEITACTAVFSSSSDLNPAPFLGRIVVQESWRLVAFIYLYMGLCGADSSDARVVNSQKKFMRLLESIKPRRNPDTFLVVPMMILGVATSSSADQAIILERLWGISECKKPETLGNDMIRMLMDLWARTAQRPTLWSDVRQTCHRITGK